MTNNQRGRRSAPGKQTYAYGAGSRSNIKYKRKAKIPPRMIFFTIVACIIVGAVAIMTTAHNNKVDPETGIRLHDKLAEGTTIDGIIVGGMSYEAVQAMLQSEYDNKLAQSVTTVALMDQTYSKQSSELGISNNYKDVLLTALEEKQPNKAYTTQTTYNTTAFQTWMSVISANITGAMEETQVSFDPDAGSSDDMFTFTEGKAGYQVDMENTYQAALSAMDDNFNVNITADVTRTDPNWTVAQLEEATKLVSVFSTDISPESSENRKHNIELAISKFNGRILWPGEELSFNETTGERSAKNGYLLAPVINNDKSYGEDYGGGVCQSSTTLYNAALLAGCEILQRSSHSRPSGYVKLGFDAMVNWPNSDLRFKNTSDYPIYFKTKYTADSVSVKIYGKPLADGIELDRRYEVVERTEPGEPEIRIDKDAQYVTYSDEQYVYVKPQDGIKVEAYLLYMKGNEEVDRVKLYTDTFKVINGITYVGATAVETPTPRPSPTPAHASVTPTSAHEEESD